MSGIRHQSFLLTIIAIFLILPGPADYVFAQGQMLPGDMENGLSIGTQINPAIAAGGPGYLAAWQDYRTSPFVGPPFSAEGRAADVYVRRFAANGDPIDPAPVLIASDVGDQTAPQVAWNGESWLVAWHSPWKLWSYSEQIQAVRIAPDGTVLDTPPIVVHTNAGSRFGLTALTGNSDPAFDGEWLIAMDTMRGVRVRRDGTIANPGGTQLFVPSTIIFFNIASAGGKYLLVWNDTTSPPKNFGQFYAADLTPIGSSFSVPSNALASNGSSYFLVWVEDSTYWDDFVFGQQLSANGVLGPRLTLAGTGGGLPLWNPGIVRVGWDATNWWAAWGELTRGVAFSRVTPNNAVLDFGGRAVDPTAPDRAMGAFAIAGNPSGGAQFVWQDGRTTNQSQYDIRSAAVDINGLPAVSELTSTSNRAQLRIDFAEGTNEILAVYLSELSGEQRLVCRRLDKSTGNSLDAEPFLIANGSSIGTPHVGFDGIRYMVVWSEGGTVFGKRVASNGSLLDSSPITIAIGNWPDVAGLDGTFLIVGSQPTISVQYMNPFSVRVNGATGQVLDVPLILGFSFVRYPRVVSFGGRWFATWQRNGSHDNPDNSVIGTFIEPDGTAGAEFFVSYGGGNPDVAASEENGLALIAYRTGRTGSVATDIYARLMKADGTFVGPSTIIISAGSEREYDPAVRWNGTDFVVAWTDKRNATIYFDERTEIYGARVRTDGVVIDPAGFAISDHAAPEIFPALATLNGGKTLIAMSSFRDESAHEAFRIVYEIFGNGTTNHWPVATASVTPNQGDVPLLANFDAGASFDPDGTIVAHNWSFGDGANGSGPFVNHNYTVPGEYPTQLTVTDDQGISTRNLIRVVATPVNQLPVALASANRTSGSAPLAVVFSARDSWDPDQGIQNWGWQFSDGGTYWGTTAYHTFPSEGTWTATLTVYDFRGGTNSTSLIIEVGAPNQPPTAVASANPVSGVSPLNVNFSSSGSSDPDGAIASYLWQFGDGATSVVANPTHVYEVGGVYTATLTVTDNNGGSGTDNVSIDVTQGDLTSVATSEVTDAGLVNAGSFMDTRVYDGVYEAITEQQTSGNPSKRKSQLSHTWAINVVSGPGYKFFVTAYHSPNGEGDDFAFEYSRDGVNFMPMLVVSANAPGGPPQSFEFPEDVSGTLFIRVTDTNRSPGNSNVDTIFVDEMIVVTSWVTGDTVPPAPPSGLGATAGNGSVNLDWADNTEADLGGYYVHRSTQSGGPFTRLNTIPLATSGYLDTGVTNGTTYHYVVTAVDTFGNESSNSAEVSAIPSSGGAVTMHVASIVPGSVNAGKGSKRGQAQVTIVDNTGAAVVGVLVTGTFSGSFNELVSATTNSTGVAVLTTTSSAKGGVSFTVCVNNVTGKGLTYDPGSNAESCGTL